MKFKEKMIYLLLHMILLYGNVDGSDLNIGARIKPLIFGFCPYALDTITDVLNIKTYYENSPDSVSCSAVELQQATNGSISREPNVGRALVSLFAVISPSWCIIIAFAMSASKGKSMNIYLILLLLSVSLLFGAIIYPFVVLLGFLSLFVKPNEGETMKKRESIGVAAGFGEGLTEAPATTVIGLVILIWDGILEAPFCLPILEEKLGPVTKGHLQVFGTAVSFVMYIKTVGTWHLYCRDKSKTPPVMESLKSSICLLPDVAFRILAVSVMVSMIRWYIILFVVLLFLFSWILAIRAGQDISTENIDHSILTASISFILCPLVFGKSSSEGEDPNNSQQIMKYQSQYINVQRKISFTILTAGLVLTACLIVYNLSELMADGKLMTYVLLYSATAVFGIITLIQSFCNYPTWLQIENQEETREDHIMMRKKDLLKKCINTYKKENIRAQTLDLNTSSKIFRFRMLLSILGIILINWVTLYTFYNIIKELIGIRNRKNYI